MKRTEAIAWLEVMKEDAIFEQNDALKMAIEALQIEIVRCKDCKHRETDDCPMYWAEWIMFENCDGYTDNKSIVHDYTTDDGYCHYGERKE